MRLQALERWRPPAPPRCRTITPALSVRRGRKAQCSAHQHQRHECTSSQEQAAAGPPLPQHALTTRRHASAAILAAAAVWNTCLDPAQAEEEASEGQDPGFYSRWPYLEPGDILPYLSATATRGDTRSVLEAIDRFATYYPMYRWARGSHHCQARNVAARSGAPAAHPHTHPLTHPLPLPSPDDAVPAQKKVPS